MRSEHRRIWGVDHSRSSTVLQVNTVHEFKSVVVAMYDYLILIISIFPLHFACLTSKYKRCVVMCNSAIHKFGSDVVPDFDLRPSLLRFTTNAQREPQAR